MKKILFLMAVASFFLFCNCDPSEVKRGRETYKAYYEKKLKDPSSFKIYSESFETDGTKVKWILDYGAKNSYGAMSRETVEFETIGFHIYIGGDSYDIKELK